METMTTNSNEILESYRAITVAATERHAVLKAEIAALEEAFPTLGVKRGRGTKVLPPELREYQQSEEGRRAASERMKARWADIRAGLRKPNGAAHVAG